MLKMFFNMNIRVLWFFDETGKIFFSKFISFIVLNKSPEFWMSKLRYYLGQFELSSEDHEVFIFVYFRTIWFI